MENKIVLKLGIAVALVAIISLTSAMIWLYAYELPARQKALNDAVTECYKQGGSWQYNINSSDACWVDGKVKWFSPLQ